MTSLTAQLVGSTVFFFTVARICCWSLRSFLSDHHRESFSTTIYTDYGGLNIRSSRRSCTAGPLKDIYGFQCLSIYDLVSEGTLLEQKKG